MSTHDIKWIKEWNKQWVQYIRNQGNDRIKVSENTNNGIEINSGSLRSVRSQRIPE